MEKLMPLLTIISVMLACGCTENSSTITTTTIEITETTIPEIITVTTTTFPIETTTTAEETTTTTIGETNMTVEQTPAEKRSCASACNSDYKSMNYSGSFMCYSKQPASYCPTSTALIYYLPAESTTCPSTQSCWCGIRETCPGRCATGKCLEQ